MIQSIDPVREILWGFREFMRYGKKNEFKIVSMRGTCCAFKLGGKFCKDLFVKVCELSHDTSLNFISFIFLFFLITSCSFLFIVNRGRIFSLRSSNEKGIVNCDLVFYCYDGFFFISCYWPAPLIVSLIPPSAGKIVSMKSDNPLPAHPGSSLIR